MCLPGVLLFFGKGLFGGGYLCFEHITFYYERVHLLGCVTVHCDAASHKAGGFFCAVVGYKNGVALAGHCRAGLETALCAATRGSHLVNVERGLACVFIHERAIDYCCVGRKSTHIVCGLFEFYVGFLRLRYAAQRSYYYCEKYSFHCLFLVYGFAVAKLVKNGGLVAVLRLF